MQHSTVYCNTVFVSYATVNNAEFAAVHLPLFILSFLSRQGSVIDSVCICVVLMSSWLQTCLILLWWKLKIFL